MIGLITVNLICYSLVKITYFYNKLDYSGYLQICNSILLDILINFQYYSQNEL